MLTSFQHTNKFNLTKTLLSNLKIRSNSCLHLMREVSRKCRRQFQTEGENPYQTNHNGEFMKSYIFIGGEVEKTAFKSKIPSDALVIAADSGYDNAKKLGYAERCDYIVGDFDSTKEKVFCSRAKIIRVSPEKNETDTHLAINLALEKGVDDIFIVGGLSGRLDHTLSNLYLLEFLAGCGINACICDGRNRVRFLKARSSLLVQKSEYKYFGLIPADAVVKGVSIAGAKYPVENVKLTRTNPSFAISNEVSEALAMVSCKEGGLFVVESKELSKKM